MTPEQRAALVEGPKFSCPVKGCGAGFDTLGTKKKHIVAAHIGTKPKANR